ARWNSANLTAFESLPWNRGDLGVIQQYWKWAQEVPVVLGGYYTGRYINNAWNQVITQGLPVRDAIEYATENINRELLMQQEAYGVNVSQ
ncbi:MAG: hypothetical protein FWF47_08355, partial [Clostridia bacterium]|nr:hypothetical protein [Clostridia bacterium]